MNPALVIGLIAAVALLFGLVVGLSVVLLKGDDSSSGTQVASTPPAPQTGMTSTAQQQPPVPASVPTPTRSDNIPVVRAPESTGSQLAGDTNTSSMVEELRKAREAAEAKIAEEEKSAAEAAASEEAEPSQKIIDWLTRSKITGVRISPTESRVILNGESFTVGEYVNHPLGLKVMVIEEKRVLFVDDNGKKYMKRTKLF